MTQNKFDPLAPFNPARKIALELMMFQRREKLFTKLNELIAMLYNEALTPAKAQNNPIREKIEKLILEETGTNIKLRLNTDKPPCCMPVMGNSNHVMSTILVPNIYLDQEDQFADAIKKSKKAVGTFDPKTGKIGGVYSVPQAPVWMGWTWCKTNLTPEEFGAVLMHEVGHCSLAFQFMFHTFRASQILAAMHQVRTGRDTSMTYEKAITIAGTELVGNPVEFERLVEIKNDKAIATVVYTRTWAKLASDFGNHANTAPNFEALADNYAIKWGYAEGLATALYNIYGEYSFGYDSRASATMFSIINTLAPVMVMGMLGMSFGLGGGLVGLLLGIGLGIYTGGRRDLGGLQQRNVYDTPLVRMQRIREGIIANLKIIDDYETRKLLLDEIKTIDSMIKGKNDVTTLWDIIAKLIPGTIEAGDAFELERRLETLANNELFVGGNTLLTNAGK